jgi:hypothetical protein
LANDRLDLSTHLTWPSNPSVGTGAPPPPILRFCVRTNCLRGLEAVLANIFTLPLHKIARRWNGRLAYPDNSLTEQLWGRPERNNALQMSATSGNPLSVIQNRLQVLRAEREQTESELEALAREKEAIKFVLPRVISELEATRESLEHKQKEIRTLDNAIEEIEANYGSIIYSSAFFTTQATPGK